MAKEDSVANCRLAFSRMRSKAMVGKLFGTLGPRYQTRPGGYLYQNVVTVMVTMRQWHM